MKTKVCYVILYHWWLIIFLDTGYASEELKLFAYACKHIKNVHITSKFSHKLCVINYLLIPSALLTNENKGG